MHCYFQSHSARWPFCFLSLLCCWGIAAGGEAPSGAVCSGDEGSTAYEACGLHRSTIQLDLKLNALYQKLLKASEDISPEAKKTLVESERAWMLYRDKTCQFQQVFVGGALSINWQRCINELTGQRVTYFENL